MTFFQLHNKLETIKHGQLCVECCASCLQSLFHAVALAAFKTKGWRSATVNRLRLYSVLCTSPNVHIHSLHFSHANLLRRIEQYVALYSRHLVQKVATRAAIDN